MLSIVTRGIQEARRELENSRKQARFAAAVALTRSARCAADDVRDEAKKDLDNPTPFTLRGFRYRKATKATLESAVYIAPIQAQYLYYPIEGGPRQKRARTGEAVPVNIRLNQYGNIPARARGKIRALMAQPDTFVGRVRGVYGLWQRGHLSNTGRFSRASKGRATNIKLLVRFEPLVRYRKTFDFYAAGARCFDRHFVEQFDRAYAQALATAR